MKENKKKIKSPHKKSEEDKIIDAQEELRSGIIPINIQIEKRKEELRKKKEELLRLGLKPEPIIITFEGKIKKARELNKSEQEAEYIKCAADPIYFIETYLTVFDQTQGEGGAIVPFKLFPFQKRLVKAYQENRFNVANKYRQAGVSTATCAYISWYVMFNENRGVAIVANKLETAKDELMNDVVEFIESCPSWLRPKPVKKDTQKLKRYDNDSSLGAFSPNGLRGYTPTLIFWDETAWTERNDKFWEGAKPSLQTGGRAIFVSTPNGLDPVFYKHFDGARKKENNFNPIELWWFNDPRYNKGLEWVKNKNKEDEIRMTDEGWDDIHRINLMDSGWEATSPWLEDEIRNANGDMRKIAQEIMCSFLGSGDNFIAEEYLKRIEEHEIQVPLRQENTDFNVWIYEDPIPGEEYVISIDASSGHGEDFSSFNIEKKKEIIEEKIITKNGSTKKIKIRRNIIHQVAEYYGKLKPNELAEISYVYGRKYNDALAIIDVTGGYGVNTVERLLEIGYENVYHSEIVHKPTRDRLSGYIKKGKKTLSDGSIVDVDLIPGFHIGSNRGSILIELQRAINLRDCVIRSTRLLNELKTFVTVPGSRVADHKRSFHDDSLMGFALGLYVINFDLAKYKTDPERDKKMIDSIIVVTSNNQQLNHEKKLEEFNNRNNNTKTPDYRVSRHNPYGANAWLFKNLH